MAIRAVSEGLPKLTAAGLELITAMLRSLPFGSWQDNYLDVEGRHVQLYCWVLDLTSDGMTGSHLQTWATGNTTFKTPLLLPSEGDLTVQEAADRHATQASRDPTARPSADILNILIAAREDASPVTRSQRIKPVSPAPNVTVRSGIKGEGGRGKGGGAGR